MLVADSKNKYVEQGKNVVTMLSPSARKVAEGLAKKALWHLVQKNISLFKG